MPRIGLLEEPPPVVMPELSIHTDLSAAQGIKTRRVLYKDDLEARIYYHADHSPAVRRPAALMSICYPDSVANRIWGGPLRNAPWYVTWCTAIASTGLVAVAPRVETRENMVDLLRFVTTEGAGLGIDSSSLGLYACSGCASTALYTLRADLQARRPAVKFVVLYYPVLIPDEEIPDLSESIGEVPILIAKAGRERPELSARIEQFVADLESRGKDVKLLVHEEAARGYQWTPWLDARAVCGDGGSRWNQTHVAEALSRSWWTGPQEILFALDGLSGQCILFAVTISNSEPGCRVDAHE